MDNKKYEVGQIHEGMVTGIQPYGAFISFPNGNHGLVHISEISSDFVRNITDYFQIGQNVRVKIIGIDEEHNYLRLSLKQIAERERQLVRRPIYSRRRKKNTFDEKKEFEILKQHLEIWIEEAYKRKENKND
jgi:general stress protein 13